MNRVGLLSDNQQKPTSAKSGKTRNKQNLFKYWILMEDSLGGLEKCFEDGFWAHDEAPGLFLWRHLRAVATQLLGTLETHGLWPLPPSSSNWFDLMNQSPYLLIHSQIDVSDWWSGDRVGHMPTFSYKEDWEAEVLPLLTSFLFFFFLSFYWTYYYIASVSCFGFPATGHMGS